MRTLVAVSVLTLAACAGSAEFRELGSGPARELGAVAPDAGGASLDQQAAPADQTPTQPDQVQPPLDQALTLSFPVNGDCISVTCPTNAPHPIGCDLTFAGGSAKGCVAVAPGSSTVYFQEGNNCTPGEGNVSGVLFCSSLPGAGLDATTCPMKPASKITLTFYVADKSKCPD